ncbi:MAG: hypothetical protein WBR29_03140 [Gammaproteobacteria bacterium]
MAGRGRSIRVELPAGATIGDDDAGETGQTVDGEVLSPGEADAERIQSDAQDDIFRVLSGLDASGEARWQVERLLPAADLGYLFDLTTAELNLATIKKRAGPGKYRCTGFRANGTYIARRTFTIARELEPPPGTAVVPVSGQQTLNDYMSFIERSKLAQKEELKFWAGLLLPLFVPVLAQLFSRKESGIGEMVAALKGLKGMTDGESSVDQLAKTKQLIELVKDLSPDKDTTGSTWPDIVRDGLAQVPTLLGALGQARAAQQGQPGQPRPGGPPLGPQTNQAPPAQPENPMFVLINWFRQQLPMLIQRAARNADPALYADLLADNMPQGVSLPDLKAALSRPDWFGLLQQLTPDVTPYQGWFTQLRDALVQIIDEANAPQPGANPS